MYFKSVLRPTNILLLLVILFCVTSYFGSCKSVSKHQSKFYFNPQQQDKKRRMQKSGRIEKKRVLHKKKKLRKISQMKKQTKYATTYPKSRQMVSLDSLFSGKFAMTNTTALMNNEENTTKISTYPTRCEPFKNCRNYNLL